MTGLNVIRLYRSNSEWTRRLKYFNQIAFELYLDWSEEFDYQFTCVEQFSVAVCVMMIRVDGNTRGVSGFSGGCAIHSLRVTNLNGPSGLVMISSSEKAKMKYEQMSMAMKERKQIATYGWIYWNIISWVVTVTYALLNCKISNNKQDNETMAQYRTAQ